MYAFQGGKRMSTISGYDSNSIQTLFSSLNKGKGQNASMDMLGINYSDYQSIRSGSYFKLMKAYYTKVDSKEIGALVSTAKDNASTLAKVEDSANKLCESAQNLFSNSAKSLFEKNEKGEVDKNAILDKVKTFVADYNSMVDAAGSAKTQKIANAGAALVNYTNQYQNMLSKMGISIDKDDFTLSVDEEKFKKADVNIMKTMFQGGGSFAYGVATKASLLNSYAKTEASRANVYGKNGGFGNAYQSGGIFNDYM